MQAVLSNAPSLDALAEVAVAAGRAILDIYQRSDVGAATKGDGSPVTAADIAAERIILAGLAELDPHCPVVAEESVAAGRIPAEEGSFWLVDPLDGTKEFLSRNGEFTVNIARIEAGAPVRGVVYCPALGELYAGTAGEGAWQAAVEDGRIGAKRAIGVRDPGGQPLVVMASRSHLSPETTDFIGRFPVGAFVSAGSSLKFCRVASGKADLYPRLSRTMQWDTAAGDAVLRAAGGYVRRLDGIPLAYGRRCGPADDSDYANPWFVAYGRFAPLGGR